MTEIAPKVGETMPADSNRRAAEIIQPHLKQEAVERLAELVAKGKSETKARQQLADEYGVAPETLRVWARQMGVTATGRTIDSETENQIVSEMQTLLAQGFSKFRASQIVGQKLQLHHNTVVKRFDRAVDKRLVSNEEHTLNLPVVESVTPQSRRQVEDEWREMIQQIGNTIESTGASVKQTDSTFDVSPTEQLATVMQTLTGLVKVVEKSQAALVDRGILAGIRDDRLARWSGKSPATVSQRRRTINSDRTTEPE